jgi:hypothetical protein
MIGRVARQPDRQRRLRRLDATTPAILAERAVTVSGWPARRLRPAVTGDG